MLMWNTKATDNGWQPRRGFTGKLILRDSASPRFNVERIRVLRNVGVDGSVHIFFCQGL